MQNQELSSQWKHFILVTAAITKCATAGSDVDALLNERGGHPASGLGGRVGGMDGRESLIAGGMR